MQHRELPAQPGHARPARREPAVWSERLAEQVEGRAAADGPIVCASGISPSGPIHLGNLREVFTTHLVAEALRARGHEVVHLHSWDDYDRLRKVPAGVDPGFRASSGGRSRRFPTRATPNGARTRSTTCASSPARWPCSGIELHEVRQSERYPAGDYNAEIRRAIEQRETIFDVLAAQQTADRHDKPLEQRRAEYFPFKAYCQTCGRDDTQVTAYATRSETVSYRCRHGHEGTIGLADGEPISGKLVWKVDWPMRWAHEGVDFEPAGEDHHAPTGSFTVGREIVRDVFGGRAPRRPSTRS